VVLGGINAGSAWLVVCAKFTRATETVDWWRIDASRVLRLVAACFSSSMGAPRLDPFWHRLSGGCHRAIFTGEGKIGRIFETRLTRQRSTSAESQRWT
jgi:hypothetical protein